MQQAGISQVGGDRRFSLFAIAYIKGAQDSCSSAIVKMSAADQNRQPMSIFVNEFFFIGYASALRLDFGYGLLVLSVVLWGR